MTRIPSLLSVTFGLLAASTAFAADAPRVPPSPTQEALIGLAANGPDAESRSFARDILATLQTNSPSMPQPDRPLPLRAGMMQTFEMRLGELRTVTLPSDIESALVVLTDVADVIVLGNNKVQVNAKAAGTTDIMITTKSGETYKAKLNVSIPTAAAQQAIDAALPGEHITVSAAFNAMIVSGTTRDANVSATAIAIARRFVPSPDNIINQMTIIGGQQVMLKVRVAEVSRTALKQLGLNTSLANNAKGKYPNAIFGNQPTNSQYGVGSAANALGTTTLPNISGGVAPLLALAGATSPIGYLSTRAFGSVFSTVADALETQGLSRTLAEPNLVTLSGRPATLNAGTQFPIPSVSQSGRVGTDYHNFGVALGFTPTVLSPGVINLEIATEVSTKGEPVSFPDGTGGTYTTPSFNSRKATSTIELPSGGSIVIGGLISNEFTTAMVGIPGLKDIPILGKLFSSAAFQRNETELVIEVTAYLVKPTEAKNLTDPTQGLTPPSDNDLYILNKLTGISRRRLAAPPPSLSNLFGFIVE